MNGISAPIKETRPAPSLPHSKRALLPSSSYEDTMRKNDCLPAGRPPELWEINFCPL